jgi:histidyl-tRNA synthetase
MEKPTLPKGTRDFGPVQMARRLFILDTIRSVFKKYGFQPLETPAMENLSTLTGKYGDEGDQLLFRILNSGDFLKEADMSALAQGNYKQVLPAVAEKGLRYDLTVPFARYVVMNQHEIVMPFRRYQIQPVWRADRPQKGRYREFYQCDADVVGTDSLLCETEIVLMIREVFTNLGVQDFSIKINHRDILSGLAAMAGAAGKETAFYVALDKLDKIGVDKVKEELAEKDIKGTGVDQVFELLGKTLPPNDKLELLRQLFTDAGSRGLKDIEEVFQLLEHTPEKLNQVEFDLSLARGLSYYTGCIFEVKVSNSGVGSVSGGGRYDNLTSAFGAKEKLSGVGISFGIDRIYDTLEALNLFNDIRQSGTTALICHFDQPTYLKALELACKLREENINTEVWPDAAKLKKQLEYANRKGIGYAIIIGEEELRSEQFTLKNLTNGQQEKLDAAGLISRIAL